MNRQLMPGSESNPNKRWQDALKIFTGWLQAQDGRSTFEALCAGHAELADELRQLHSAFQLARTLVSSRSLQQTLRDPFGEDADVTVKLEHGFGALPHGGSPAGPAQVGTPSARYALEGEVARGGMGVIWRVRDCDLSRTLAMKVMADAPGSSQPATDATTKLGLARFLEEAQVTAQLDHPGIVPVHEVGFDAQGQPFFTMKLVKGRDLNEIFKLARAGERWTEAETSKVGRVAPRAPGLDRPAESEHDNWNLPRAVGVIVKACQALAYAHSKGVIHRDLKPANIMVGRFGEVFVMDWGLAKITGKKDLHDIRPDTHVTSASFHSPRREAAESTPDSPLITMDGSVVGTPAYMPPEQARGQVEEVDQASDIYSLGAILYNLLTGQPPYVEPGARISPHTILGMVIQGPPQRVHLLNPQAPPELIAICEKAMARQKGERYASSLDLAEDLQAYLDNRVVKAYQTGAVAEFRSWVARNKGVAVATGASVLLLVFAAIGFMTQQRRANERLRLNSYVAEINVASHALTENNLARATELLARQIPRRDEKDLRGFEWRYLWQQARGNQLSSFSNHTKFVASVAFSPDGRLLASGSWDDQVKVADLASEQVVASLTNVADYRGWIYRHALAFAPDGKTLAMHVGQGIRLYATTNWRQTNVLPSSGSPDWQPMYSTPLAFSPDGRTLAAWGTDKSGDAAACKIVFWDTSTWTLKPQSLKTNLPWFGCLLAYSPDGKKLVTASDGQIQLWEAETGGLLHTATVAHPWSIAYSRDGRWLAVGEQDGNVRLWEGPDLRKEPKPIKADSSLLYGMVFSADSQQLFTGGADQVVRVWDLTTLKQVRQLQGHASEMWSLAVSPDGRLLVGGTKVGQVMLWDAQSGVEDAGFAEALQPLAFSFDGHKLLTRGTNFTFTWVDLSAKRPVSSVTLPIASTSAVLRAVSPDGSLAAFELSSTQFQIWDLVRVECRASLTNDPATSTDRIFFSADNRLLVAGCIWPRRSQADPEPSQYTGEPWTIAAGHHVGSFTNLMPLAISVDGRMIAGETFDYRAKVVNLDTRSEATLPLGHKTHFSHFTASAFSPDGRLLATSSYDGDARLWDVQTGQLVHRLSGHKQAVTSVAFSPDGRTLVSGGNYGDVKFWNVATGKELFSLAIPSGEFIWIAKFSPDGQTLVLENTRHILRAPSLAEIDAAEKAR